MLSHDNISKDILSYQTAFLNTLKNEDASDDNINKDETKENDEDAVNDIIKILNQIDLNSILSSIDDHNNENDNKIVVSIFTLKHVFIINYIALTHRHYANTCVKLSRFLLLNSLNAPQP